MSQRRCAACPNPQGCGCLATYAKDQGTYLVALQSLTIDPEPRRLSIVPPPPEPQQVYEGDKPQPWQARPPRHRKAA